jgi:hypothetical protein
MHCDSRQPSLLTQTLTLTVDKENASKATQHRHTACTLLADALHGESVAALLSARHVLGCWESNQIGGTATADIAADGDSGGLAVQPLPA